QIPQVGPNDPNRVPEGTYQVVFRYGAWEGNSHQNLQVVAQHPQPSTQNPNPGPMYTTPGWPVIPTTPTPPPVLIPLPNSVQQSITQSLFHSYAGQVAQNAQAQNRPPNAPIQTVSIEPLRDGIQVFPRTSQLIQEYEDFLNIAVWGFDEEVRFSANGQRGNNDPPLYLELRRKALEMRVVHNRDPRIKVLIWEATVDNDYTPEGNYAFKVNTMVYKWRDIEPLSEAQFMQLIRSAFGAEREDILLRILELYRQSNPNPETEVYFPTGVHLVVQNHPIRYLLGSHHQKIVLTEKAAYVGGLNFLREYWDDNEHAQNDNRRETSGTGVSGGGGAIAMPLHDTGAILKGEKLLREVADAFNMRWNMGVPDKGGYPVIVDYLESQTIGWDDLGPLQEIVDMLRGLQPRVSVPTYNSKADPAFGANQAFIRLTLPRDTAYANSKAVNAIRDEYELQLNALKHDTEGGAFFYAENQFFEDYDFAQKLFEAWLTGGNHQEPYFAFIVIPWKPDTHPMDWGGAFSSDDSLRKEFEILRWLEIKTARKIYVDPDGGKFQLKYEVEHPHLNIDFEDEQLNHGPEGLKGKSWLVIREAYVLDENGARIFTTPPGSTVPIAQKIYNVRLQAREVMADSDIMAFSLVSSMDALTGGPIHTPVSPHSP
ncbi:MAG: hypothetical protein AAF570_16470, partial [Bacteroidota bacterium]